MLIIINLKKLYYPEMSEDPLYFVELKVVMLPLLVQLKQKKEQSKAQGTQVLQLVLRSGVKKMLS